MNAPKRSPKQHRLTRWLHGLLLLPLAANAQQQTGNTITVHPTQYCPASAAAIHITVIKDNIFHITAKPKDSIPTQESMQVTAGATNTKYTVASTGQEVIVSTTALAAHINKATGKISFIQNNKKLTEELWREYKPAVFNGYKTFGVSTTFSSDPKEAFYGLGQHQNGEVNYRKHQVVLAQNNTEVAVPFLVSDKHYGILWDNASITRCIDTRKYLPLADLKLYDKNGGEGYLTATYYCPRNKGNTIIRPESAIAYNYLKDMSRLPEKFCADTGTVTWEGTFSSPYSGVHEFLFRYAGYGKVWIDGKLMASRWRQAWNPGTEIISANLQPGKKYQLKVEWIPNGGESFAGLEWMPPAQQDQFGFASEAGEQTDYYFIAGATTDELIAGYRYLTGKATILPNWAYGLWQSRERYKTQKEILETVSTFREKKIPLDNIVLDWSYWKEDSWGSQEFESGRFPDAENMIKKLHDEYHTHFMISVWPKFYEGITSFNSFDQKGWLYRRNVADKRRDWIGTGYVSTFYDAYNPEARKGFWQLVSNNLYSKGVDAWWLDASEPDIHSNISFADRQALMLPTTATAPASVFNAYPLENARAVYEGQRTEQPDKRVFILTRSGFGGLQRYAAATWSGDIAARWEDMKTQIAAGINFSFSGLPYWTMDIGGFAVETKFETAKGDLAEEWREQMTRWYQFGSFCPLFRVHGQFPYREIYNTAPENHTAYQSMMYYDQLRYRLMPYIYSMAGKAYHHDYTLMRGLLFDYAADTAARSVADEYMFGQSLLVCPVTGYKARTRDVYLPAGSGWYNWNTGKHYAGGQHITADAPYENIPLFVPDGAIIPMGPEMQYTGEKKADTIALFIAAGKDGQFTLYEDEGQNYNYEKGIFTEIGFSYKDKTNTLEIAEQKGSYPGMPKERTIKVCRINSRTPQAFNPDATQYQTIHYTGKSIKLTIQ